MAGLRAAQKAMTRKLLLGKALELFTQQSYARTTIDEIASAAGTTRVTFYAHFPSKADLMRALIDELNELLDRTASPTHGSTASALVTVVTEGTPEGIRAWLRETAGRWDIIRPYTNAAFESAVTDPALRTLMDEWFEEPIGDIADGLDAAGRFSPETRRLRGVLAMAQLDHAARHWRPGVWDASLDVVLAVLTESWTALLTDKA
ncbi:transcriptional regulator, TetR family [Promicromonospora umidemergens]|nr:TetR/AcrR family transcriptional regulator [Promicromonospora umidemergens]MCP2285675.1 transcriptional regulator, TetR family [Promicromonospora umidemergens]